LAAGNANNATAVAGGNAAAGNAAAGNAQLAGQAKGKGKGKGNAGNAGAGKQHSLIAFGSITDDSKELPMATLPTRTPAMLPTSRQVTPRTRMQATRRTTPTLDLLPTTPTLETLPTTRTTPTLVTLQTITLEPMLVTPPTTPETLLRTLATLSLHLVQTPRLVLRQATLLPEMLPTTPVLRPETLPQETLPQEALPPETLPPETPPLEMLLPETLLQETLPLETLPPETLPLATLLLVKLEQPPAKSRARVLPRATPTLRSPTLRRRTRCL
jgi:hypothetical protein